MAEAPAEKPKTRAEKIDALKKQQAALAKRLNALTQKEKTEERKRETRRKIIVGGLVLGYMEKDPSFADTVRGLIAAGVTRPHDLEAVAGLLPSAAASLPASAPASEGKPVADFGKMWGS